MKASLVPPPVRALLATAALALVAAGCTGEDTQGVHYTFAEAQAIVDGLALEIASPAADHVFADGAEIAVAGGVGVAGAWPDGLSFSVAIRDGASALRTRAVAMSAEAPSFSETFEGPGPGWYDAALTATLVGEAPDGTLRTASAEVTSRFAINTPAPAPTVTVRPTADGAQLAPGVGLTAVAGVEDDTIAPGAALQLEYRWFRDEEPAPIRTQVDDPTLPGALVTAGATLTVRVRANDGFREGFDGAPAGEASVVVPNAAASCGALLLAPAAADTTRDITCRCTDFGSAIDGEDRSTCVFRDGDGEVLQDDGSCTLPAEKTEKGMVVTCELTPKDDGGVAGSVMTSTTPVTVLDAAPSAPEVAITPSAATAEGTVTCEIVTHGVDPDGDSVTYEVRWKVNGETVAGVTTASTAVSALGATGGDEVVCEVKAVAGGASSAFAASAALTLDNAAPQLPNVLLTSAPGSPPTVEDTLTCDASQATDPDDPSGESLTFTYEWFIDDALIEGAEGANLSGDAFARGDVVKCRATACDPHGACTAAVNSKTSALVQNAPPSIGAVLITGARPGGVGEPGDTLTCEFSGWYDADGDEAEVSYTWSVTDPNTGVTTVITGQTSEDYTVSEALAEGAIVTCTVTPHNGDDEGEPRTADGGVTIVAPSPIAPVVAVVAPDGADGEVTCAVVEDAQNLPAGVTWTWRWSLSGAAAFTGEATLAADEVSHCDLVKCWAELSGPNDLALTSNEGQLLMPLGTDCDDGNPCSGAVCFAAGGCNLTAVSGPSCDNGDPCTTDDYCDDGICSAGIRVCVEDRLSVVGPSTLQPAVAGADGGGYVTHWFGSGGGQTYARATDGDAARVYEEVKTSPSVNARFRNTPVPLADGGFAVLRSDQLTFAPGGYAGYRTSTFQIRLRRYAADGTLNDETAVTSMTTACYVQGQGHACNSRWRGGSIELIGFSDGSLGALRNYANTGNGPPYAYNNAGIALRLVHPNLTTDDLTTLVPGGMMGTQDRWHATVPPDGIDHILVAWTGAGDQSVYVQRFGKDGSAEDANPILVADVGAEVTAVRAAGFRNGRFVVVWESTAADGLGLGIAGQRFDDGGARVGDVFQATAATLGDQTLGDVAALSNYDFVIAYRDLSDVDPAVVAQRFDASATPQGAPVTVNAASDVGAAAPSIAPLDGDEWVVAWNDAANVLWTRRFTADGELAPRAAERRVAQTVVNDQRDPAAAAEAGGNTLVAWASAVYPGMGTEIMARVFNGDGVAVTGEFIVNDHIEGGQLAPAVAGGPDRFVVAWTSEGQDGSAEGVYARVFDGAGASVAGPFVVPETTADYQRQPAVAMTTAGDFAVAWNGYLDDTGSSEVLLRVYNQDGSALTGEIIVNNSTTNAQEKPAVAAIPFQDAFIVTWQSRNQDGSGWGVYMRKIGKDGSPLSPELRVNTVTDGDQREPAIAVAQNDLAAICWASVVDGATDVLCQLIKTSSSVPQGGPFTAHPALPGAQEDVAVVFLTSGRLMVAWATESLDHDGFAVQAAYFNNLGTRVDRRLLANRYWDGDQRAPWIVGHDERVFLGYQSDGQDGDGLGVYFRSFPLP